MDSAIVDRLSKTQVTGDVAAYAAGRELGRRWAEAEADYRDLQRLARKRDLLLNDNGDLPLIDALSGILSTIPAPFREEWAEAGDDELVAGFVAGAADVFDEFIAATA
ncbi:MAG: hypothetical protein IT424_05940 [Pirellulales bacterium]|nr:hypothetical protein [Pirellulales bacterium]